MNNATNIEENDEHALSRLFRLVSGDPSLVPSHHPRHEGWVIQGTLMETVTDFGTEFLLIGDQKRGHELCTNAVHVQI